MKNKKKITELFTEEEISCVRGLELLEKEIKGEYISDCPYLKKDIESEEIELLKALMEKNGWEIRSLQKTIAQEARTEAQINHRVDWRCQIGYKEPSDEPLKTVKMLWALSNLKTYVKYKTYIDNNVTEILGIYIINSNYILNLIDKLILYISHEKNTFNNLDLLAGFEDILYNKTEMLKEQKEMITELKEVTLETKRLLYEHEELREELHEQKKKKPLTIELIIFYTAFGVWIILLLLNLINK